MQRRSLLAVGRALLKGHSSVESRSASGPATALARLFTAQPATQPSFEEPGDAEHSFRASDLLIERSTVRQPPINLQDLKFGTVFTDHMFLAEHAVGQGWAPPAIKPLGMLQLHPASQVLHYGMCAFEGMKAYQGADGRVRLFRPDRNMARLRRSARRLQLADFDPQELLECLKQLLLLDRSWLPAQEGYSLYIRPFAFASSGVLGVAKPSHTTMSILLSPVGPYFPTGLQPVSLFVDEHNRRAWPGGAGDCKIGGNYAPTIMPQVEAAQRHGVPQVVYTFKEAAQHPDEAQFEEAGAMNVFFYLQRRDGTRTLATPPLAGTILPGVTRDSILQLARHWGAEVGEVEERPVTIAELREAHREGRLLEMFGSGTACVVQPVGSLVRASGEVFATAAPFDAQRSLAGRLQRALLDIQYGRVEHPWSVVVE
ncbi:hypothetical protein ABPG77_005753 [Micractinium sp. CCAP 211/92]